MRGGAEPHRRVLPIGIDRPEVHRLRAEVVEPAHVGDQRLDVRGQRRAREVGLHRLRSHLDVVQVRLQGRLDLRRGLPMVIRIFQVFGMAEAASPPTISNLATVFR